MAIFALSSLLFFYVFLSAFVAAASQIGMLIALCVISSQKGNDLF